MDWQLSQRALDHSVWITQLPLSKSKLEVMQQAMLFLLVMCTELVETGFCWFQPTPPAKCYGDVSARAGNPHNNYLTLVSLCLVC